MLRRIGFDRFIKLDWLNKTAEIYAKQKDYQKIKQSLDEFLMEQVIGDSRRKTINVLTRTWVTVEPQFEGIRDKALELFEKANRDEKLAIHWCLLMIAYPIFSDICATIGNLIKLQDGFSLGMVRRRIYEIWGERSSLRYASDKIVRSITEWGAVEDGGKPGEYYSKEPFIIDNIEIKLLLIEAYLIATNNSYLQFTEVDNLDELFPFKLDLGLDDFQASPTFNINKMGSDIVIGL